MGQRIAAVDAYIAKQQPFARPILRHVRAIVHAACPQVTESIKWGMPFFSYQGPLANMAAFKAHATFGFWQHRLLAQGRTSLGRPAEKAMGSFGRLASVRDLPPRATLLALVRRAARLNEEGVKRPARPAPRRAATVRPPAWVLAALRRDRRATATWAGLPPGQRREYLEWLTGAKTEPTRERRLATAVQWLAEGKRFRWKYERR